MFLPTRPAAVHVGGRTGVESHVVIYVARHARGGGRGRPPVPQRFCHIRRGTHHGSGGLEAYRGECFERTSALRAAAVVESPNKQRTAGPCTARRRGQA